MKELWPHQVRTRELVNAAIKAGYLRPLIVLPCGAGKTFTAGTMACNHIAGGGTVLWLTHTGELVDQSYAALTSLGLNVGIIQAGKPENPNARIQVASIQTLIARGVRPPATLVVVDECHHAAANTWAELISHYAKSIVIGLSATPARQDGRALDLFNRLIVPPSVKKLTEAGFLVPAEIVSTLKPMSPGRIAQRPVDLWLKHAQGVKTIVYAGNAVAAEQFLTEFKTAGVRAAFVFHDMADRTAVISAYRNNQIDVLINIALLTEGFDDPSTECVILARTIGSVSLFLQIVSRAARAHANKSRYILLDPSGQVWVHGKPDEDRQYSLTGKGIRRKGAKTQEQFCIACGCLCDPDADVCNGCGIEKPQLTAPTVTGDPMEKFAFIRSRNPDEKRKHWLKLVADGANKGHHPGAAFHKYRSLYEEDPPRSR